MVFPVACDIKLERERLPGLEAVTRIEGTADTAARGGIRGVSRVNAGCRPDFIFGLIDPFHRVATIDSDVLGLKA